MKRFRDKFLMCGYGIQNGTSFLGIGLNNLDIL
jgi:hypothetical protein